MPSTITTSLLINGHFPSDDFCEWIMHHATKLNLSGWVKPHSDKHIEVLVTGNQTLIDALEVACSLGPIDAHIETIVKQVINGSELPGRQAVRFVRY